MSEILAEYNGTIITLDSSRTITIKTKEGGKVTIEGDQMLKMVESAARRARINAP